MATYEFSVAIDGKLSSLSLQDLRALLGTLPEAEPDKPVPVFGEPRTYEGDTAQGHKVFSLTGANYLWLQIGENPDAGAPRGTNLPYTPLPGRSRLTGNDTKFTGSAEPANFTQPAGYRKDYFLDEKGNPKKDEPYYIQSDLPNTVIPDLPTPNTAIKPTANMPMPDPDQKRATLNDLQTS